MMISMIFVRIYFRDCVGGLFRISRISEHSCSFNGFLGFLKSDESPTYQILYFYNA